MQIRNGFPLIEKIQQGSGEWLRGYLAPRQKILENELPFAPIHDHEGRSQIPRLLPRFRGGVRGTRFRARRTPRNCWLPPDHNSAAVLERILNHLGLKPGVIFLSVQEDFTSASAPLSFLIFRLIF